MESDCVPKASNACCRTPGNVPIVAGHLMARRDFHVRVCVVCGCRHFELTVDPGHLGLTGARLG